MNGAAVTIFEYNTIEDILQIKVFVDVLKFQEQINPGDMFGWIFNVYLHEPSKWTDSLELSKETIEDKAIH